MSKGRKALALLCVIVLLMTSVIFVPAVFAESANHVLEIDNAQSSDYMNYDSWDYLQDGAEYTVTMKVKGNGKIRVTYSQWGNGAEGCEKIIEASSSDWVEESFTFKGIHMGEPCSLIFYGVDGSSGTLYVDDVSLTIDGEPNILHENANFEEGTTKWVDLTGKFAVVEDSGVIDSEPDSDPIFPTVNFSEDGSFIDNLDNADNMATAENVKFDGGYAYLDPANSSSTAYMVYKIDQNAVFKGFTIDVDCLENIWSVTYNGNGFKAYTATYEGDQYVKGSEIKLVKTSRTEEINSKERKLFTFTSGSAISEDVRFIMIEFPEGTYYNNNSDQGHKNFCASKVTLYSMDNTTKAFYDVTIDDCNSLEKGKYTNMTTQVGDNRFGQSPNLNTLRKADPGKDGIMHYTAIGDQTIDGVIVQYSFWNPPIEYFSAPEIWYKDAVSGEYTKADAKCAPFSVPMEQTLVYQTAKLPANTKEFEVRWIGGKTDGVTLTVAYGSEIGTTYDGEEDPPANPDNNVLQIDVTRFASDGAHFANGNDISADTSYTVKLRAKGDGSIRITVVNGNWHRLEQITVGPADEWTDYEFTFNSESYSGWAGLVIYDEMGGSGSVFVDDIIMTAEEGSILISNDFQSGKDGWFDGNGIVWKIIKESEISFTPGDGQVDPPVPTETHYDVPYLMNPVTCDGVFNADEWFESKAMVLRGNANNDIKIYFKYDHNNLYVAAVIKDSTPMENNETDASLWIGDSLEFFYATDNLDAGGNAMLATDIQIVLSGGIVHGMQYYKNVNNNNYFSTFEDMAIAPWEDGFGYTIEAVISLDVLEIEAPWRGRDLIFNANYKNSGVDGGQFGWTTDGEGMKKNRGKWGTMTFLQAEDPEEEITVSAYVTPDTGDVTISGKVLNAVGATDVTLLVKDSSDKIVYIGQTMSDADGKYSIDLTMDAVDTYTVTVGGTGIYRQVSVDFEITKVTEPDDEIDYSSLNDALAKYDALNKADYTASSWIASNIETLAAAGRALLNDAATQDEVNKMAKDILSAINSLKRYTPDPAPSYLIQANAGEGGSISPVGNIMVDKNVDQTFTIIPDKGYEVDRVLIDRKYEVTLGNGKYTFKNVNEPHTIDVTFKKVSEQDEVINPETPQETSPPKTGDYTTLAWAILILAISGAILLAVFRKQRHE